MEQAWVGFDLDGTLVRHGKSVDVQNHEIGPIIPEMLRVVRAEQHLGYAIKIFTARVSIGPLNVMPDVLAQRILFAREAKRAIEAWCLQTFDEVFESTCEKDFLCIKIYDDRARHVICNTGRTCCDT